MTISGDTKLSINESLLQSYRGIFISSESIFLGVAGIFYGKSLLVLTTFGAIGILTIWYIWRDVVVSRALIVDFYKYYISEKFDNDGNELDTTNHTENLVYIKEETYVHNGNIRRLINSKLNLKNQRPTRVKIDLILPIIYTILWVIILIAAFVERANNTCCF